MLGATQPEHPMERSEALAQARSALSSYPVDAERLVAIEEQFPGVVTEAALQRGDGGGLEGAFSAFPLEPTPSQDARVDAQVRERWSIPASAIQKPTSLAKLVATVRAAVAGRQALRPIGSARSQSDVADPANNDLLVSTARLGARLTVDATVLRSQDASSLYRCEAGRTVGEVIADLDGEGRALPNMGAGNFQAVVGAIQTCTHGSGATLPALPDLVVAMTFVTVEDGAVVVLELERAGGRALSDPARFAAAHAQSVVPVRLVQDDDLFHAAVVCMGCMGVVYSVTLSVVPQYWLVESRTLEWWSKLRPSLASEVATNRNFEVLVDPWPRTNPDTHSTDHQVLVTRRNLATDQRDEGHRPATMALAKTDAGRVTAGVTFTLASRAPLKRLPKVLDTAMRSTVDSGYQRRSYEVLLLQLNVNAVAEEVGVPAARAADAADAILDVIRARKERMEAMIGTIDDPYRTDPEALYAAWRTAAVNTSPFALRFVAPSEAWLAMPYQQATCMIELPMGGADHLDEEVKAGIPTDAKPGVRLYQAYLEGRQALWRDVESALAPLGARPHWGLWNAVDPVTAAARYPKWGAWASMVRRYNALGTFDSPFTTRMGLSANPSAARSGALNGDVVVRVHKGVAYLKIKGAPGFAIFNALTGAPERRGVLADGAKRKGVHVIASTENLVDPVVAEFHFDAAGALLEIDGWDLFHSLTVPRTAGSSTLSGDRLTITGDAAGVVSRMLGRTTGDVVLQETDSATGVWVIVA